MWRAAASLVRREWLLWSRGCGPAKVEMIPLETPLHGGGRAGGRGEKARWHCNATSYQEGSAQPQKMSVPQGVEMGEPLARGLRFSAVTSLRRAGSTGVQSQPRGFWQGLPPGSSTKKGRVVALTTASTVADRCWLWGGSEVPWRYPGLGGSLRSVVILLCAPGMPSASLGLIASQ